jgi:intracellular sulfur oxidation DsrE/DsrF family protein
MAALTYAFAAPDDKAHRVVFDVTVDGTEQWEGVLNNVENARRALGRERADVRVIAHGKGIGLLRKTNTALAARIASLAESGVRFAACENTMKRLALTRDDLLPSVGTVDSGVAEIIRLQGGGWAYLKSGD